ncbi:ASN_HP2_G0016410.mRNA.1.CDS.1 [Saccharomyces cerevisiae]|nr:ASN_HP2_G0016410.mRNA.1.CDS.1 [Saccharomyces cerevisiae]CAI6528836.1 ASN_HP2_G0016410.mRNA.1.CDS.1 [Saccharomyces cerevisiae]
MGIHRDALEPIGRARFLKLRCLYVPQQHPARDLQDIFYIKAPLADLPDMTRHTWTISKPFTNRGDSGPSVIVTTGSQKNVKIGLENALHEPSLPTLHDLAKDPKPTRLFSIDRCFP